MNSSHKPRKSLGQNFLIDQAVVDQILYSINPLPDQHLVEIGPGQGALTKYLIASGARLDAIELDLDLAQILQVDFANCRNFSLYHADILKFELQILLVNQKTQPLRLIGNLPYNISTPLMFKLFDEIAIIQDMHFMLQREVAERLVALPNTKAYGRMSIMAQYFCAMEIVLDVPPNAFNPAPKVNSSVVRFVPHAQHERVALADKQLLQQITTLAFNQRRKTIANSMKSFITAAELQQLGIDPKLRAENLALTDYATIVNYLHQKES